MFVINFMLHFRKKQNTISGEGIYIKLNRKGRIP